MHERTEWLTDRLTYWPAGLLSGRLTDRLICFCMYECTSNIRNFEQYVVCGSLSLSLSLSLTLSLFACLPLSLSLSLSLVFSLSLVLSLFLSLSACLSLSLLVFLCLPPSLSLSLCVLYDLCLHYSLKQHLYELRIGLGFTWFMSTVTWNLSDKIYKHSRYSSICGILWYFIEAYILFGVFYLICGFYIWILKHSSLKSL